MTFNGSDYYLGAFLVGAYQEILGDLHNLFGDTNAVHVRLSPSGEVMLDEVIKGDTVREVLDYVQFKADALVTQSAQGRGDGGARRPAGVRGVGPPAAVLRRRAARVYVSGRSARAVNRVSTKRGIPRSKPAIFYLHSVAIFHF